MDFWNFKAHPQWFISSEKFHCLRIKNSNVGTWRGHSHSNFHTACQILFFYLLFFLKILHIIPSLPICLLSCSLVFENPLLLSRARLLAGISRDGFAPHAFSSCHSAIIHYLSGRQFLYSHTCAQDRPSWRHPKPSPVSQIIMLAISMRSFIHSRLSKLVIFKNYHSLGPSIGWAKWETHQT